jgi:hypothetical protein
LSRSAACCEGQLLGSDLVQLSPSPKSLDRKRRSTAAGENDVQAPRSVVAERFDQAHRRFRCRQLVDVVDDEHELSGELLMEGFGQP